MSNAPRLSTSSALVLWQKSQQKSMKISPLIASTLYVQGDSSHFYSSSPSDETEDYKQLESPLQVPYNLTKIPRYALQLVRGDISSNLGASLSHALLLDLRDMGLLIPNIDIKNIYMDKRKIEQRLKCKQMPMKSIMKMWRIFFVLELMGGKRHTTLQGISGGKWK